MNKSGLIANLELNNISFDEIKINKLISLMKYTLIANEKFNLTAIKNEEEFIEKMIFDSALAISNISLKDKKCIDVGTGAGFPGLVLAILENEAKFTLLDSTNKKIEHIRGFAALENLNLDLVSDRAELFARKNIEKYDFAFARAVASLNVLLEIISPILKVGGTFVALKGPGIDKELLDSKNALKILGLEVEKSFNYVLPESKEERNIVLIKKIKTTPNKYPREYAAIKKRPL
jgi:16S rRNA (guanine527-N7)-methyltransferase